MRVTSRGEALFMAVFLIVIGLFACLTGRLTGSPTRAGTYTVEGPVVSVAGGVLVFVGLWVIFSIAKDKFFH